MLDTLAGLKTIFFSRGDKLDQGSTLRFLNETMWFPTDYLGENMHWEKIEDKSATIKFSDAGWEVEAALHSNKKG